ncbi:hypothetical protein LTR66_009880 [Elasticomyces elasticus]|nr:hypothetical protein LTR66_009880 [Elasticomyces elasticus]KAK4993690.1 hypothetical protein LTR50_000301 [Elasticomyces elasticus]
MASDTAVLPRYNAHPHSRIRQDSRKVSRDPPATNERVPPIVATRTTELPRSASYTYIPQAKHPVYDNAAIVEIKGSFSENDLIASNDDIYDVSPVGSSGWTTPERESTVPYDQAQDLIAALHKSQKITVSRLIDSADGDPISTKQSNCMFNTDPTKPTATSGSPRPAANSFTRHLRRKSWYPPSSNSSRSPSPPSKEMPPKPVEAGLNSAPTPIAVALVRDKSSVKRREPTQAPREDKERDKEKDMSVGGRLVRKASFLTKRAKKPGTNTADDSIPAVPSLSFLPKSFSTDRLPTYHRDRAAIERMTPVPRQRSAEKIAGLSTVVPKKKDELWTVFRTLDGDHTKFQSKSSAFKANVIRSSLLPFLRTYANHPSNHTLRPEDLDRRAVILNKWWTGLIEMLHGRNNQSISGTDRPAILDGISGIMERPEWRLHPSPFCPLRLRKGAAPPRSRSTSSLTSNSSGFLAESVFQNVRNIFTQNLNAQMAFVVDKMSLRNASASLVTFCGKACAYAFFFCPGIADVLLRLWDPPIDTMRRVLDEYGVSRRDRLGEESARVISNFPPHLQQLGFSSLASMLKILRQVPPLPHGMANIQWYGYWLERWAGRESDLFYTFVKQYHILVTDFLPEDSTKRERVCVPGLLLVHAQILANLDSTIHRDAGHSALDHTNGPSPTFDDVLSDPDVSASALPLPPTNAIRIMAENRLVMLIRDFSSERTADHPIARQIFAESFNCLLQACARRTSIFDHAACYTLCDFLEESLIILVRYEHLKPTEGTILDSSFWLDVCKRMISSQNTMTEIRLYAFLYTVWSTVVCDLGRKADLCLALLLDEDIFESRFNHWCPMVRAYYMRLLCWRVGRFDGEANDGDLLILETLSERLRSVWSHYVYLREDAEARQALPPSTAPCNPAPGRRILIIRTDSHMNTGGSFLSFDGIVPPAPSSVIEPPVFRRNVSLAHLVDMDFRPSSSQSSSDSEFEREPGIKSFFRNMIGSSKTRSKSQSPQKSMVKQAAATEPTPSSSHGNIASLTRSVTDDPETPHERSIYLRSLPPHRNFCFKFSLDYHPKAGHHPHHPQPNMRLHPPRLPMPAQMFLQSHSATASSPPSNLQNTPVRPQGAAVASSRYAGRALAEWTIIVGECQSFFDRRRGEGVPRNKLVETPTLGVEVFRKPS